MKIIPYLSEIPTGIYVPDKYRKFLRQNPIEKQEFPCYFDSLFTCSDLENIPNGKSVIIHAPVGSGKSTALVKIAIKLPKTLTIVWVTNRKALKQQTKILFLKEFGFNTSEWPAESIELARTENIEITTYQELAARRHLQKYPDDTIFIFDEIHYLLNDATFSYAPMRIYEWIRILREYTRRIYISATVEEVAETLRELERDEDGTSRIYRIYMLGNDCSHLQFRFYDYHDVQALANAINAVASDGNKAAVFVRDKERGRTLQDLLTDSEFIYAGSESESALYEIAQTEQFTPKTMVSTKVLENGVSITDSRVNNVVIEELDPVAWMQFLGRIRVSRSKPRKLTVWIPDYTEAELRQYLTLCHKRLQELRTVQNDPEGCMRLFERYHPDICYFNGKPSVNFLAQRKLNALYSHIQELLDSNVPHAHIRFILKMLNLPQEISDSQFLTYDDIAAFKSGVRAAYEKFTASPELKADRDQLAKDLIKVVSSTSYYKKKVTGSQLQLDKINDILTQADIQANIISLGEAFKVVDSTS